MNAWAYNMLCTYAAVSRAWRRKEDEGGTSKLTRCLDVSISAVAFQRFRHRPGRLRNETTARCGAGAAELYPPLFHHRTSTSCGPPCTAFVLLWTAWQIVRDEMKKRKTNNAAGKLSTAPPRYPHDERIRTGSRCIHGCGIAMSPPAARR